MVEGVCHKKSRVLTRGGPDYVRYYDEHDSSLDTYAGYKWGADYNSEWYGMNITANGKINDDGTFVDCRASTFYRLLVEAPGNLPTASETYIGRGTIDPVSEDGFYNAITTRFEWWRDNVWDTGMPDPMDDDYFTVERFKDFLKEPRLAKRGGIDVSSGNTSGSNSTTTTLPPRPGGTSIILPTPPDPLVIQEQEYFTYGNHLSYHFGRSISLPVFCGVPAWKEEDNTENPTLHLGEIPQDGDIRQKMLDQYGAKTNGFVSSYPLHTYNLTKDGISSFLFPFCNQKDEKGFLSNWNSGSEPVCEILARVLREQFFRRNVADPQIVPGRTGHKYAFAYVFRKNVPKIVFVFSNEYDNWISRTHYYNSWSDTYYDWQEQVYKVESGSQY